MKIYTQLAKFQQEVGTINKDSKGYGYNYASLDNIVAIITPFLKENNLGFTHTFDGTDIICTLFNTEGEIIASRLSLSEEKPKLTKDGKETLTASQLLGVAITYARRYTLTAILGLVTDEDTDGVAKTASTNKSSSQVQNMENKKWFSLESFDGKPINDNIKKVQMLNEKYKTAPEIIKYIEGKGYALSKKAREQIEILINT
jgi:hypothetical protein